MKVRKVFVVAFAMVASLAPSALAASSGDGAAATKVASPASAVRSGWPQVGFNGAHLGFNPNESILGPENVHDLVLEWSSSTGNAGNCCGNPVVSKDGIVVVSGGDFYPRAFDATTGA